MGGVEHWMLYLAEMLLFCAVGLSVDNRAAANNQAHLQILEELKTKYSPFPKLFADHRKQYGVLYLPHENPTGTLQDIPVPDLCYKAFIYPSWPNNVYNYAASVPFPDRNKTESGQIENIFRHTEDSLLNFVFPVMYRADWYWANGPVYLYTYLLPCETCFWFIQNFVNA